MEKNSAMMRIKAFLDIYFEDLVDFTRLSADVKKTFFYELHKLEYIYDAKIDITLLTGRLAKPGDYNWGKDGRIVWQILSDFEEAGLGERVTSYIGINSITPHDAATSVKTTSGFHAGQVHQYLEQFEPVRDDILFYLYGGYSPTDGMYWNHYMIDELKNTRFVYICLGNKKIFGRGEIFDCQFASAYRRGDEFEYQPEKTPVGMASLIQGLKHVTVMKKVVPVRIFEKDMEIRALNAAERFLSAIEQIDENVLQFLPAEKLNELFVKSSKLQHTVFQQTIKTYKTS
jgi:hypothetical protein